MDNIISNTNDWVAPAIGASSALSQKAIDSIAKTNAAALSRASFKPTAVDHPLRPGTMDAEQPYNIGQAFSRGMTNYVQGNAYRNQLQDRADYKAQQQQAYADMQAEKQRQETAMAKAATAAEEEKRNKDAMVRQALMAAPEAER